MPGRYRKRSIHPIVLRGTYGRYAGDANALRDETLSWVPPVDVYETDEHYVLAAEVPGVEPGDVRVQVAGSELIISGERRFDAVCSEENYHRLEGIRGRFHRAFSLPEALVEEEISARLQDGVLHVVLPKRHKSRKIPIHSTGSSGAEKS